jgi:hypothetical protein
MTTRSLRISQAAAARPEAGKVFAVLARETDTETEKDLGDWLGGRDSNPDNVVQRCRE